MQEEGDESDDDHQPKAPRTREADMARKECKAKSVLNKFKEMERKALNGETEDGRNKWGKRYSAAARVCRG